MIKYPYLIDEEFLKTIDYTSNKTVYSKIHILNNAEDFIATIEGLATGGSITMNNSSALRRSGSLTMVADSTVYKITNINNLISLEKKVELEIGVKNINGSYYNVIFLVHKIIITQKM